MKKVKCRYKHCLHDDVYLDKQNAILDGSKSYYHPDCYKEKKIIDEIIDRGVDAVANFKNRKTITEIVNDIIFNKNVSPEEFLFKIKKYVSMGKPLNYPRGLYYMVNDTDVNKAYTVYRNKQLIDSDTQKVELVEDTKFTYVCPKRKTIVDILV